MEFNKRRKSIVVIYAIIAVAFTVLTLIIPFSKQTVSWIMFAFSIVSVIAGCGITIYAFGKSEKLKSKFYGFPVFRVGFLYTAVQIGLSVVVFGIGEFVDIPYWVGVSLSTIILCAAAIGVVAADNARDYVEEIDINTKTETKNIKRFHVDIADCLDTCTDPEIYTPLKNLVEKFKYSDCVSSEATKEKEEEIKLEIEGLKELVASGNAEMAIGKIESISNLLSSRNRICEKEK